MKEYPNILAFHVNCPTCKLVCNLDVFDFKGEKWDCTSCDECDTWFSYGLFKYKHYVIPVNIIKGFVE